jgi:hypothetical protein
MSQLEQNKDVMNAEQYAVQWAGLNKEMTEVEAKISGLNAASRPKGGRKESVDNTQRLADEAKYLADRNKLLTDANALEQQTILDQDQSEILRKQQELMLEEQHLQTIAAISQQYATRKKEMDTLLELENQNFEMRKVALAQVSEDEIQALRLASLDNQIKMSDNAFAKIALGAQRASVKSGQEFIKFEKIGGAAVAGLANGFTTAFSHVADGNFDLARDMKKAIIGALADEAQARGALLIASSIWPPNPLSLAGGLGLVSLSGVLRSLSGSGGGASIPTASASSGGGFPTSPATFGPVTDNRQILGDEERERERKQVSIVIHGNYFETEQTRQRLVEIIRDSADYSDFKVQSVGGGL